MQQRMTYKKKSRAFQITLKDHKFCHYSQNSNNDCPKCYEPTVWPLSQASGDLNSKVKNDVLILKWSLTYEEAFDLCIHISAEESVGRPA